MRTRPQLEAIRDGGGMVALMMKDDVQDTDEAGGKYTHTYSWEVNPANEDVRDDCRHSSKSWAQSYQYLADLMGNGIALGSDFNGMAGHLGPRFGSEGCSGTNQGIGNSLVHRERSKQYRDSSRLEYPFTIQGFGDFLRQNSGQKEWDYNVNGLAHIGLYPDFLADLRTIGLTQEKIEPIFQSAEEYVKVWERSVAAGTGVPTPVWPPPTPVCKSTVIHADALTCTAAATIVSASDFVDPDVVITQSPPGPYPIGTTSVKVTASSPNQCGGTFVCTATVTVVDKTGPRLLCPRGDMAVECKGANTPVTLPPISAPLESCSPPPSAVANDGPSDGLYPYGLTKVTFRATDAVGNEGQCSIGVLVRDTIPPKIICPPARVVRRMNAQGAFFTPDAATSSDLCNSRVVVSGPRARVYPLGTTRLVYTADDGAGNTASCTTSVTVSRRGRK